MAKKVAVLRDDTEGIKLEIKKLGAKMDFRKKAENQLCAGNSRQAWEELKTMMGRMLKRQYNGFLDTLSILKYLN